jgi:hypothetical protein
MTGGSFWRNRSQGALNTDGGFLLVAVRRHPSGGSILVTFSSRFVLGQMSVSRAMLAKWEPVVGWSEVRGVYHRANQESFESSYDVPLGSLDALLDALSAKWLRHSWEPLPPDYREWTAKVVEDPDSTLCVLEVMES